MKIITCILFCLVIYKTSLSQAGKYYGEEYACTLVSAINQFYWIELKKDKTFEFHIFYLDDTLICKNIEGNWQLTNDTLYLNNNDNTKYYYLYSLDTIKTPNNRIYDWFVTEEEQKKYFINKGIDDFGLGITEMIRIKKALKDKNRLGKKTILRWTKRKSC
jgi:hypothetical protein